VGADGQVVTPMTLIDDATKNTAVSTTIPSLVAEGNTPLLGGLETARGTFASEAARTVVLLSDGYHNCPSTVDVTDPAVTDLITDLNADSVKVYTIGFGRPTDIDHPLLETLAADTGGQFYDVTGPSFDPAVWDPATDLAATYKAILVDTLGLETAADPLGVIRAGEKVTRPVGINEHDRRVSFFLSWVKPDRNRLGLVVSSSDGVIVPIRARGVRFHQGQTYQVLTVDASFLGQPGKVGPTPWWITIEPRRLDQGEQEEYQYSVILDSALKMDAALDSRYYTTGDKVVVTAALTEAGRPIAGLTRVQAVVAGPEDGLGNWFAANKVDLQDIPVPGEIEGESLPPLLRKSIFLTDIRQVPTPGRRKPTPLRLYDDGAREHADRVAGDGVYTNIYTGTVKEGMHSFHVRAQGPTSGGSVFDRDDVIHRHVSVKVVPKHVSVQVLPVAVRASREKVFKVVVTPKDALGNFLGPRYSGAIEMASSKGAFVGKPTDHLDGTYTQMLRLPTSVDSKAVEVRVSVKGAVISFNLADKLQEP
jgi:hypothetical protein